MTRHRAVRDDTQVSAQQQTVRPMLRGHLHFVCALLAPFALGLLLMLAETPRGYAGATVFGVGLIALYSVSAAYHVVRWPARMLGFVARLDHATIFLFVAASYTPFCLALGGPWGVTLLPAVWALAITGAALRVAWPGMPRWLRVGAYLGIGWLGIAAAPAVATALDPVAVVLVVSGGLLFSVGAFVYALRYPDPAPRVFGYHEVFHVCVVAGTTLHYGAVAGFVLPG